MDSCGLVLCGCDIPYLVFGGVGYKTGRERSVKMKKMISIKGETFLHDTGKKMLEFTIREPWNSAGKHFGWTDPVPGIGISQAALKYCLRHKIEIIQIKQDGRIYETTPQTWLDFTHKHNSKDIRGQDVEIYVMQFSTEYFTRVHKEAPSKIV